ncbi:MAG TPA: hypothetical protein VNA69_09040 [Thermoanaerobaculia bacterium]|nr:hypothetical protein [Thermoanaerobaculia bacterium]
MKKRLQDAEALLALVEAGLKQVTGATPERRVPGMRNILVFGSLYTTLMEAIASKDPLFASWLDVQKPPDGVETLRRLMLRPPKTRRDYTSVQLASAGKAFGPRPAGARVFFSSDRLGGTGWEIEIPGGHVEKYYVALPDALPSGHSFDDTGTNVESLARRYVMHLREIMKHAKIAMR